MLTKDVINHFSDPAIKDRDSRRAQAIKAVADALGIRPPSIYGWGDEPPQLRQLQLEQATGGILKAHPAIHRDAAWNGRPDRRKRA